MRRSPAAADGNPTAARPTSVAALADRARALASTGGRRLLGITGSPGAGKTTTATTLVEGLGPDLAVLVPMDGFHLSNATLQRWGRRGRKGAWDTFDAAGYVHLLRRLRAGDEEVVHAPDFDRDLDEPLAAAVAVPRSVPLVVTEGNYLLSELGEWRHVAALLHESWYLEVDDPVRQERLVGRHVRHGMALDLARAWALSTDQANAELVAGTRRRADRRWVLVEDGATPP